MFPVWNDGQKCFGGAHFILVDPQKTERSRGVVKIKCYIDAPERFAKNYGDSFSINYSQFTMPRTVKTMKTKLATMKIKLATMKTMGERMAHHIESAHLKREFCQCDYFMSFLTYHVKNFNLICQGPKVTLVTYLLEMVNINDIGSIFNFECNNEDGADKMMDQSFFQSEILKHNVKIAKEAIDDLIHQYHMDLPNSDSNDKHAQDKIQKKYNKN